MSTALSEWKATAVVVVGVALVTIKTTAPWVTAVVLLCCIAIQLLSFSDAPPASIYRKNASTGLQCCPLLPMCLLVSSVESGLAEIFAVGSLLAAVAVGFLAVMNYIPSYLCWSAGAASTLAFVIWTWHAALLGSIGCFVAIATMSVECYLHCRLPRWLPQSFTVGESAVIAQAAATFLLFAGRQYLTALQSTSLSVFDQEKLFAQTAVLSCAVVIVTLFSCRRTQTTVVYYIVIDLVAVLFSLPILAIFYRRDFITWIAYYVYNDSVKVMLFIYWTVWCCILWLIVYVNASWLESRKLSATQGKKCQHSTGENKIGPSHHSGDDGVNRSHDNVKMFPNAEKCCHLPGAVRASSTVIRKQFHVVAVAMFVPGLLMDVNMLRVAVSCALVVLVMLESLRVLRIKPFGDSISRCFQVFVDDRDEGKVIMTHIYLLVGCSCPLWLHSGVSGSSGTLQLYSGLLSLGVGDTAASVFGSTFGCHKWPNSHKTIEGSTAAYLAQLTSLLIIHRIGNIVVDGWLYVCVSVALVTLLEALTSQIDNLILPLFTYMLLAAS